MTDKRLDLNSKYEYPCPVSGQVLYYLNDHAWIHTMDGPSKYQTIDGKYVYEEWPRGGFNVLYVADDNSVGYEYIDSWREFRIVADEKIFLDDPFFEDKARRARVWMDVHNHLANLKYERSVKDGTATFRRVYAKTVSIELVTVQPMSAPSGMLWFIDTK